MKKSLISCMLFNITVFKHLTTNLYKMSFILWLILCLSLSESMSSNPLCDQSVVIDSSLVYDNRMYLFTGWTVTVIDMSSNETTSENITKSFTFENSRISDERIFRPPVDVVYYKMSNQYNKITIMMIANVRQV